MDISKNAWKYWCKKNGYELVIYDKCSREDLFKLTGGYPVPQIVMNETPIGGFDQLLILNQKGKLNDLSDKN